MKVENLSKNLVKLMKSQGVTQMELAYKTGLSSVAIYEVCRGKYAVRLSTAIKIAKVLDTSLDSLVK